METKLNIQWIVRILSFSFIFLSVFSSPGYASTNVSVIPEGYHDGGEGDVEANNCSAFGWTVDPDNRDRDLDVRILSDDDPEPVATTVADLLREDVSACPGGTCGFNVDLWGLISAGETHQITVQAFDVETAAWVDLESTPKDLTCHPYIFIPIILR